MPAKIDWMYNRKNCVTCQRARGYLTENHLEAKSVTDAVKERQGPDQALKLARSADVIHVARGKKLVTFDMKNQPPDEDVLLKYILGPTGNLRAPTIRRGRMLFIGFSDEGYEAFFAD